MKTIEEYWTALEKKGFMKTNITGGFSYDLPPTLGKGGFKIVGDPSTCFMSVTDMTFDKPFIFLESVQEKTIEFCQYSEGDVCFYQKRSKIHPIDYGLNYWVNHPFLSGYKRVEAHQRLFFTGICYRQKFFENLADRLPGDFWETAAAVLNPGALILPAVTQICTQLKNCQYTGLELDLFIQAKTLEAFAVTFDYIYTHNRDQGSRPQFHDRQAVERTTEILLTDYAVPPSLRELSRRLGINQQKLMTSFKQINGITIYNYVKKVRMEKAAELLHDNRLSISEISTAVGYHGDGHFQQAFKQQYGTTPVKFRNELIVK